MKKFFVDGKLEVESDGRLEIENSKIKSDVFIFEGGVIGNGLIEANTCKIVGKNICVEKGTEIRAKKCQIEGSNIQINGTITADCLEINGGAVICRGKINAAEVIAHNNGGIEYQGAEINTESCNFKI